MAKTTLETKKQNLGEICVVNGLNVRSRFLLGNTLNIDSSIGINRKNKRS